VRPCAAAAISISFQSKWGCLPLIQYKSIMLNFFERDQSSFTFSFGHTRVHVQLRSWNLKASSTLNISEGLTIILDLNLHAYFLVLLRKPIVHLRTANTGMMVKEQLMTNWCSGMIYCSGQSKIMDDTGFILNHHIAPLFFNNVWHWKSVPYWSQEVQKVSLQSLTGPSSSNVILTRARCL